MSEPMSDERLAMLRSRDIWPTTAIVHELVAEVDRLRSDLEAQQPATKVDGKWSEMTDAEKLQHWQYVTRSSRVRHGREYVKRLEGILRVWTERPTDGHVPVWLRELIRSIERGDLYDADKVDAAAAALAEHTGDDE